MQSHHAIQITDVCFSYPATPNNTILDIPSFQVEKQQRVFLSGPSGSGKSTLLNLLCGTLTPNSGSITLLGQPFSSLSTRRRDTFRAQHIGVVFQQFNLIPYLTVEQNILAAAYFAGTSRQAVRKKIETFLPRLNLSAKVLGQRADQLSVGQQQRVAICRALVNEPELLVVDEPTSALDADAQERFMQLLLDCAAQTQSTLLFVSHNQSLAKYFDMNYSLNSLNRVTFQPAEESAV